MKKENQPYTKSSLHASSLVSSKIFFLIILVLPLQNCLPYLFHVGKEQFLIISKREKIENVINKSEDDSKLVYKLKLIQKAREFAINELALSKSGGFEYYTKIDREEVGWNVSASYPLKFESYKWWFPIAGSVPYKGFFDLEKAKEEESKLIEQGFDTRVRITGGYSTLGWFSDPVLSPQLRMREDELVALVIHEMTHGTLYFPGDSVFNESYASFVEDIGTELFFQKNNIDSSDELLQKRKEDQARTKFILARVKETALKLKDLYENESISESEKLEGKAKIIKEYKSEVILNANLFKNFDVEKFKKQRLNNENFIGILRYHSGSKIFREKFSEVGNNFPKFHKEIEKLKNLTVEERAELLKD